MLIIPKISPHKNSTYLPTRQQQTDGRTICCWSDSPRISGVDIFIHKPNKQYPSQPPSSRTICCYVSIYFCFSVNTKFQENFENLPKISTIYYRFIFGRFPAGHAFAFSSFCVCKAKINWKFSFCCCFYLLVKFMNECVVLYYRYTTRKINYILFVFTTPILDH